MTIHPEEPLGCTFRYDRGRWVQIRSNVPDPEDHDGDGEMWVPNHEAVCHANGIVIIRGIIGAFGRAKIEIREEDGMDTARFYRMGRDWLLKFGYDEDGNRVTPDPIPDPDTLPLEIAAHTTVRLTAKWEATVAGRPDGLVMHRVLTGPMKPAQLVAEFIQDKICRPVEVCDIRDLGGGWYRPEGWTLRVRVEVTT